ncbi:MAG: hypothetical protein WA962_04885 [Ornithinimicrobium sp.]
MTIQHSDGSDDSALDDAQTGAQTPQDAEDPRDSDSDGGPAPAPGQVSEAGGASLNAETSAGGADAVPDSHG